MRPGSIYGLADRGVAAKPLQHGERERKLYIALLILASMNVFVISAGVALLLLVHFE